MTDEPKQDAEPKAATYCEICGLEISTTPPSGSTVLFSVGGQRCLTHRRQMLGEWYGPTIPAARK